MAFSVSDWIATGSAIISVIAIFVAVFAIRKGNRNSSVATLVTLNEGFRQAWQRFLSSQEGARDYEFAELMNLLEIACAIDHEQSLAGVSKELAREYIGHVLLLLETDKEAAGRIQATVHDPTTFKYIRMFRERMRG